MNMKSRMSTFPTLPTMFKTNTNKDSSRTGNSANGAGSSTPAPELPRHLEQTGSKNFARFSKFLNNSTIRSAQTAEPSAATSETSEDIRHAGHQRRLDLAEKMMRDKTANIDLCTKIDWEGYASKDLALAHHVRALQKQVEAANGQLKADMTATIRSMPDSIRQELEKNKPDIVKQAKEETRKGFLEKLATGVLLARPLRKERLAVRDKLVQERLDALEQDLTGKFQQGMASKEAGYPVALRDPCVMFFRKEFGGNGPELLEQLVNDLGVHAKKAMSGELTESGIAENSSLPPAPKRQNSLSNTGPQEQREIPRRASVISENTDKEVFDNASERIATVSKETTEVIEILGGDSLDSNIKRFLENKGLPDAKLNDKGEVEWTSKT